MAVLTEIPGLVVGIEVNGQDLPEYDDDEEETSPTSCTKYVEAVSGANFALSVRFDGNTFKYRHECVSVCLDVDGQSASVVSFTSQNMNGSLRTTIRDAVKDTGAGLIKQALHFAELKIGDEAPDKELTLKVKSLGIITARCYRSNIVPRNAQGNTEGVSISGNAVNKSLLHNDRVSEKNLKGQAISHQVGYGRAQPHTGPLTTAVHIGPPFGVYNFKYRSRSSLQALRLVPRTPSPAPPEDPMADPLRRRRQGGSKVKRKKLIKTEFKRESDSQDVDDSEVEVVESRPKKSKRSPGDEEEVVEISDNE